jgi:hypothetical protein
MDSRRLRECAVAVTRYRQYYYSWAREEEKGLPMRPSGSCTGVVGWRVAFLLDADLWTFEAPSGAGRDASRSERVDWLSSRVMPPETFLEWYGRQRAEEEVGVVCLRARWERRAS